MEDSLLLHLGFNTSICFTCVADFDRDLICILVNINMKYNRLKNSYNAFTERQRRTVDGKEYYRPVR